MTPDTDQNLDEMKAELAERAARIELLSDGARAQLDRLLASDDRAEIWDTLSQLRDAQAWTPKVPEGVERREWTPDDVREATSLARTLVDDRDARADRQRESLKKVAKRLGEQVGSGQMTVADAEAELSRVLDARDEDHVLRVFLVPYREARTLAERAFAEAVKRVRGVQ